MSTRTSFIPQSDDKLVPFLRLQIEELTTNAATLGLDPATVAAAIEAAQRAIQAISSTAAAKAALASQVASKEAAIEEAIGAIRSLATQGKNSRNYTEAIGGALNWITPGNSFDPSLYKAEIRSALCTGPAEVSLEFRKANGNIDAVNVYGRRSGESQWRLLNLRMRSPYIDHTPLAQAGVPEAREYRLRAVVSDQEIGEFSDVVVLTVT